LAAPVPSVGTFNTYNNDLGLGKKFANGQAWSMIAARWSTTVTAPHYISENKSDMRGIKPAGTRSRMTATFLLDRFPAARNASTESLSRQTGTMASRLQQGPC
jgi:hypothetical protein